MKRLLVLVPLSVASCATTRKATDEPVRVRTIRGVRGNVAIDPTGEVALKQPCPSVSGNAFDDGYGTKTDDDVWATVDEVMKGKFIGASQESLQPIREAVYKSMKRDMIRSVHMDARSLADKSLVVDVGAGGSYSGSAVSIRLIKTDDGYDVQLVGMRSWCCVSAGTWVQGLHGTLAVRDVREDDAHWLVGVFDLSGIDGPLGLPLNAPVDELSVHAAGSFRLDVAHVKNTLEPWVAEDMTVVNQSR